MAPIAMKNYHAVESNGSFESPSAPKSITRKMQVIGCSGTGKVTSRTGPNWVYLGGYINGGYIKRGSKFHGNSSYHRNEWRIRKPVSIYFHC